MKRQKQKPSQDPADLLGIPKAGSHWIKVLWFILVSIVAPIIFMILQSVMDQKKKELDNRKERELRRILDGKKKYPWE